MTNEATTPSGQPLGISHKPSKSVAMFTKFKAENKPAFIGYLPYGFPNPDVSLDAFKTMVEHGVDAVLDHRLEGVKRDVRVGEAVGQVADEGRLVLGLELGEHSDRLAGLVADAQRLAGRRGCFIGHNQKSPLLVQATVLPWAPATSSAAA